MINRFTAGIAAMLEWQPLDSFGEPTDPGAVTVSVSSSTGAVVTSGAASGAGVELRTFALTAAHTATVDRLSVAWSVAGEEVHAGTVDVVGGVWFGNDELRAAFPAVSDRGLFPARTIAAARSQVEDSIERWTGRAWVPTLLVETIPATCRPYLIACRPNIRRVRWATLTTTSNTTAVADVEVIPGSDSGLLYRPDGWGEDGMITVAYEAGADRPTPQLKAAAMRLCAEVLAKSKGGGLPENASSYSSTELGWSAVLVTPGVRGAHTSIPSVNEAIDAHTFDRLGVG